MDNIEDLLRALTEDDDDGDSGGKNRAQSDPEPDNGLFGSLDPEMLMRMLSLFETLNQPDDNERFLLALKPLLRVENQAKIDSALRLLKLFTALPILKDAGFLGKLL